MEMNKKKKTRTEEEKKALNTRLNKTIGQMNGVKKMIDEDRYCEDILIQLAAIDRSIKSLADLMLESHMHSCLINDIQNGDYQIVDEVIGLFKKFR